MLRAPVRARCVARKLSASVITVLAEPAEQPTPMLIAESRAAWSASCCSWLRCHSTDPVRRMRAAEPISASIQTATMTRTWPSCGLRRTSVLEPRHRLRVEGDRARDAKQRVEDRFPLELHVDDHQLMSGCAYRGSARPCACRTAPARIGIARVRIQLIDEDVDSARVDGPGQGDAPGQQGVRVGDVGAICGRARDRGRVLVYDGHTERIELMGPVGERAQGAWRGEGGAARSQRVRAVVV